MANIVVYSPSDPIVANRVIHYFPSANTPDYDSEPNKLVDPDLSALTNVSILYWKYNGSGVVEMNSEEKRLMANLVFSEEDIGREQKLIRTSLSKVHSMRRILNVPLYAVEIGTSGSAKIMDVYCVSAEGVSMHVDGGLLDTSADWNAIKNHVNTPIMLYDKRIVCHDLADSNQWNKKLLHGDVTNGPFVIKSTVVGGTSGASAKIVEVGSGYVIVQDVSGTFVSSETITCGTTSATISSIEANSKFIVHPDTGFKFILTHSIVRFPDNLKLVPTNKLYYEVWLSPDGVNPPSQPTIQLIYEHVTDLFRKATAPFTIAPGTVAELGVNKEVEVLFQYADPHTLKGSPVVLRSSLGEKIQLYLAGNTPFLDVDNQAMNQECNISMNFRKTIEF